MKKKIIRILLGLILIIVLIPLVVTGPYLWNNWVTYPRLEKERAELWSKYKKPMH